MSKTVVIHQPDFLPYLGFFHRFLHADFYVVLDHVQFSRRGWTHRDQIKGRNGAAWLSLSVKKGSFDISIRDVELLPRESWCEGSLNLLRENYQGAAFFGVVFPELKRVLETPFDRMFELNMALIDLICGWLEIKIEKRLSSSLVPLGTKSEMIAGLVAAVGGTRYLSGLGAREYHDEAPFERRSIEVVWQDFTNPVYPQQFGEYVPYLSAVDALFNCGPEATARMLRSV
jgi:hypothetical protein